MSGVVIGDRAIVLGGSVAGSFAARVLSDWYTEVIVVDRDTVLGVDTPRRGNSHTAHAHGLHARGLQMVEELFPNTLDELRAARLPVGDLGEMHWYVNARLLAPAKTGLWSVTPQRPVLENYVRNRVAGLSNVTYRQQTDILAPTASADKRRITGVRVRDRATGVEEVLTADLVLDATGRGSRLPVWLEELGYARPDEDKMKIGLAYTTRIYRKTPEMFDGVQSVNLLATPAFPRGCFFGQVAHDECILSLTGMAGDHPPTDEAGFMEFVRSLPVPRVYEAVKNAEPLTDAVSFTFPASVRRRYERLRRFPAGLLVMGDAVCSFNPVYGQGMSVAALQAAALRDRLASGVEPTPRAFLKDLGRIIDVPWEISTSGDLDFPEVEGKRTLKVRMGNAFMARVQQAAVHDASITDAFMQVAGLAKAPPSMMKPSMIWKVMRQSSPAKPVVATAVPTAPAAVPTASTGTEETRRAA